MKKLTFETNPVYLDDDKKEKRLFLALKGDVKEIPYFFRWFIPLMTTIITILLFILILLMINGVLNG